MAHVCQKCGHTGFQQVMIYCRQCRIACEHKYCLYKFPKKGEKIRWYCEECKPTVFASSLKTMEVDTGRGKSYPESIQKLQNQEPNSIQKFQNKKVQEEAESMKASSDLCENEKSNKRRKLTISNDSHLEQKAPDTPNNFPKLTISNDNHLDQKTADTPSNHFPPPVTSCGDTTMHEVYPEATTHKRIKASSDLCENEKSSKRRKLTISNDSHLDQKTADTPSNHFPPPVTSCGDTTMHEVSPEATTHKNTNSQEIEVHRQETFIQNIPTTARPVSSCGDMTMHEISPETTTHKSTNSQEIKVHRRETSIQNIPTAARPVTSCGDTTMHEEVSSETTTHKNTNVQEIEVHRPETSIQNIPTTARPVTSCGDKIIHEVSVETTTHMNTNNQEIEVHRPETFIQNIPTTAQPVIDYYVWRGCISFGNGEFIPFRAHLSCLACQRVFDAAKRLPPIIPMDKYLRRDLEHNIFKNGPPTGDGIGLYFFPDIYAKPEHVLRLIDDSIRKDLMFVYTFDELELFIFLSCILPEEHHKFNERYYFWGGFRQKQLLVTTTYTNHHFGPNNKPTENIQDKEVNRKVKAEAQANLFGSPITGKLQRIIQGINEKHTQNNNKSCPIEPTATRRTIEEIQAEYRQTKSYDNSFNTHRRRLWNPQNNRKDFASRFTDERRRTEGHAYNNLPNRLTQRQRSLYELKKKQNRDVTGHNKRTENGRGLFESREIFEKNPGGTRFSSRVKRKTETNGEDWIAYFEQDDRLEKVTGPRSKRNRTRNDCSEKANAIEEKEMNNRGDEDEDECNEKQNCMEETVKKDEQIAGERSASPVSSTCTEEQKPRGILEKFVDLEEGEISS